ncbi:MAG: FadR/GntR family transcriptional regulator [Nitrospinales bacterium]
MVIKYDSLETKSLARQISDNLQTAIFNGDVRADERLPSEHELAEKFEVSRPTIREALKILAARNLTRSRRGPSGGTFVKKPTREEVQEIISNTTTMLINSGELDFQSFHEARYEFETFCCRLAAERRKPEHLTKMKDECEIQKNPTTKHEDFCHSDVRFHRNIVDATGNPLLRLIIDPVFDALQPIFNMAIYRYRNRDKIVSQHKQILAAIKSHEADKAVKVMVEQLDDLNEQMNKAHEWRKIRDKNLYSESE